jgi:hypothetical protein
MHALLASRRWPVTKPTRPRVLLMERSADDRDRIRELNDAMRQQGPGTPGPDKWLLTPGLLDLGDDGARSAVDAVKAFDVFTNDNDPYGEHDFGAFDVDGARLFWKIDYYDRALAGGSPDPTDASVTCRVLTIMLAWEY